MIKNQCAVYLIMPSYAQLHMTKTTQHSSWNKPLKYIFSDSILFVKNTRRERESHDQMSP